MEGEGARSVLFIDGAPHKECSGVSFIATDELVMKPRGEQCLERVGVTFQSAHCNAEVNSERDIAFYMYVQTTDVGRESLVQLLKTFWSIYPIKHIQHPPVSKKSMFNSLGTFFPANLHAVALLRLLRNSRFPLYY